MRTTIELPQVGESVTEGVIGKWLVEPGQRVEKYDPLVEVVTDKVSMEAPSPYAGVFVRALVEEGETVPMGEPICEMEIDAAAEEGEPARQPSPIGEEGEPSPRPSPIGRGSEEGDDDADEAVAPQEAESDVESDVESDAGTEGEPSPRPSPIGRGREEVDADEAAAPQEAESAEQGEPVAADAESDAEPEEEEDDAEPDVESDADAEEDGDVGRVGGAWAMPAAQDEQAGGDSDDAAQAADSAPQEDDVEAEGDAERPATEHPFEFVGSVRSVGPTGSGERGEGRPDAAQEAAVAAAEAEPAALGAVAAAPETEPVAQEEVVAAAVTESTAQEAAVAAEIEPATQEAAVAAPETEPVAQEAGAAPIAEPAPSRAAAEPDRRHVVSPLVARLSAQYGIDLSTVRGTGTGGRVTSQDLLNAVSAAEASRAAEEAAASEQAESVALAAPPQEEEAAAPVAEASEQAESIAPGAPPQEQEAAAPVAEASEQAEAGAPAAPPQEEQEDAAPVAEAAEQAEAAALDAPPQEEQEAAAAVAPPDAPSQEEEAAVPATPGAPSQEEEQAVAPVAEAVEQAEAAAPGAPSQEEEQGDNGVSLLPVTPIRRAIAEHMARSASEIPSAWAMVEADATGLVRARDARKDAFERERGVALTYLPFLANAAAQALRERPKLNARWDDGRIILNNRVNLSIAVATDAGLMVPVLRDADALSVAETAVALRRLTEAARNGALTLDDVQGGTFTLNNTGALGSVVSVPIINHPQAAILTTEAIVKRPVVIHGDAIAARAMMNLCISFDHRVCDGADAAGFLRAVKDRLEALDESAALG